MRVTVFGTGYVGLVTGACFAEVGHEVACVDVDTQRIDALNRGEVPIYEPGLETLIANNHASGRLKFTTDAVLGIQHGEFLFIAVGTPPADDGSADLNSVLEVARTIGRHIRGARIVVNKSTVPVGTSQTVARCIARELNARKEHYAFEVVSNPEFLKEGSAIADCMRPDRIVLGTANGDAVDRMRRLYAPLNRNRDRIVVMDSRSAELTKYAANAMLATKISFINEMARIAERVGADIEMVRQGIGSDPRIGWHFIYPGAGYGGSCFPKDVRALCQFASVEGYQPHLLKAVEAVNERQKSHVFDLVNRHYGGRVAGKTFAVLGLSFKPETDDLREAPSSRLLQHLWAAGARVRAFDPQAMANAARTFGDRGDLVLCNDADAAIAGAHALIVMTEWKEFRSLDPDVLHARLLDHVVFDGRNIYLPADFEAAGLAYYGVGRGRSCRRANSRMRASDIDAFESAG